MNTTSHLARLAAVAATGALASGCRGAAAPGGVAALAGSDAPERVENPVELGLVHWGRKLEPALETSQRSGRPVLLLFQEIPG